jgi:hypothetical protein
MDCISCGCGLAMLLLQTDSKGSKTAPSRVPGTLISRNSAVYSRRQPKRHNSQSLGSRMVEIRPSDQQSLLARLPRTIARIKARERKWATTGRRRALNRFLQLVFDSYCTWHKADVQRLAAKQMIALAGKRWRPKQHPVRTIIEAVSGADRRTKSRWSRALRYAWLYRRDYDGLKDCLGANGGIAGCASKWAELRSAERTPSDCVRLGGDDRIPKIPLLVGKELFDDRGRYIEPPRPR